MRRRGPEGINARVRAFWAIDFVALVATFLGVTSSTAIGGLERLTWALGAAAAGCLAIGYAGGYRVHVLAGGRSALVRVSAGLGSLAFGLWAASWLGVASGQLPATLGWAPAFALPAVLLGRGSLRAGLCRRRAPHRVLLIGSGSLACRVAQQLPPYKRLGVELAGLLVEDPDDPPPRAERQPVLGGIEDAEKQVFKPFDCIVVACGQRDPSLPAGVLLMAKLSGREVISGIQFYEDLTQRLHLEASNANELAFSDGFRPSSFYAAAQRVVDIAIAGGVLLVAAPLIVAAAFAVKLDSRGPVFYKQARMGQGGRVFRLWKLRSMRPNAEHGTGPVWTRGAGDLRVTRVGRILRLTRIDELPQLWNVVKGEMSLVGPRPERPEFLEELQARYPHFRLRHVVRPGITGWAQTRLGYVNAMEDWEHKLALDLFYVKHRSIWFDLWILLMTPKTLLMLRGM